MDILISVISLGSKSKHGGAEGTRMQNAEMVLQGRTLLGDPKSKFPNQWQWQWGKPRSTLQNQD